MFICFVSYIWVDTDLFVEFEPRLEKMILGQFDLLTILSYRGTVFSSVKSAACSNYYG